jgi:hypothetical protein
MESDKNILDNVNKTSAKVSQRVFLEVYKGYKVFKSNATVLNFNQRDYKKIIDTAERIGASIPFVCYNLMKECDKCGNNNHSINMPTINTIKSRNYKTKDNKNE